MRPYGHSGIGTRRLAKTIFECQVGLDDKLAFVFIAPPPKLVFFFLGNRGIGVSGNCRNGGQAGMGVRVQILTK